MRVTDFAQQNFIFAQIQATQGRTAEQNIAITTGRTAQRYSGIANDAKRLVSIEATHVRISRYSENNQIIDTRLQTTETAVGQLVDLASSFRTQLVGALNNNNASVSGIDIEASNLLQQVAGILNTDFDGRYLFAGSKTNTQPVDLAAAGFGAPPSTYPSSANTSYYLGNDDVLAAQAGPDLSLDYGIRANEAAFEKFLRSLKLVSSAIVSPVADQARLNEGLRLAEEAVSELALVVSRIGVTRSAIETANKGHSDTLLYAEQTIGDIANTDLAKAITILSGDRASLEASFATLAQMRTISLINFL
ncbi:MAG: flagellin N-terminal helical domain-containing protein [Alphaproteobacteria bacterium]